MKVDSQILLNDFDSRLEGQDAVIALTVSLRLWLQRLDTNPIEERNGKKVSCRAWTLGEWSTYVRTLKRVVERVWNNRFWLKPPADFSDFDFPSDKPNRRPSIECRLELELFQNPVPRLHRHIRVVHLADGVKKMRSNSRLLDNLDVKIQHVTDPQDHQHVRNTAVHKVGHWLSREHPCKLSVFFSETDPSDPVCYAQDWIAVMGYGMTFRADYAQPWLDRIAAHTGMQGWDVLQRAEPAASLIPGWY